MTLSPTYNVLTCPIVIDDITALKARTLVKYYNSELLNIYLLAKFQMSNM